VKPIDLRRAAALGAVAAAFIGLQPAAADPVADFYKGKTVQVIVGAGMGGSYGLYGQLAARHIAARIPGSPTVVVQSMPGAGGLKALAYEYNVAARDGSILAIPHAEVLQETVLNEKARFDAAKFSWIGRFVDVDLVGFALAKSGVTSLDVAKRRQVIVGSTGLRSVTGMVPVLFNRIAGTKFKIVVGYKGVDEMFLAQQKGEVEVVPASWVIAKVLHANDLKSGSMVAIFSTALERSAELPNTPSITEFGRNDDEKMFLRVYFAGGMVGRALAAPPGVPAERLAALRKAFDAGVADPGFAADVAKRSISINVMRGEELAARIDKVMQLTPAQVAKARKIYADVLASVQDKGK
jgi:tripartite-type tricarboxylate transporter receptor subunit TctC